MFLVYRPAAFPEISQLLASWDRRAQEAALPGMFFVKTLTAFDDRPDAAGCSAAASGNWPRPPAMARSMSS